MQKTSNCVRSIVRPTIESIDCVDQKPTLITRAVMGEEGSISVQLALQGNTVFVYSPDKGNMQPLGCIPLGFHLKLGRIYHDQSSKMSSERTNSRCSLSGFRLRVEGGISQSFRMSVRLAGKWIKQMSKHVTQENFSAFYKKLRVLGKGSSACIYEYRRMSDSKHFAVKTFEKTQLSSNPGFYRHFIQELNALKTLNHPNLLHLQEVFEDKNNLYVVTPYLGSTNMFQFLLCQQKRLSLEQVLSLMGGLLRGLEELDQLGLVHRDIKLENVMIQQQSSGDIEPVIVDMGLVVESPHFSNKRCGTPGYISPDLIQEGHTISSISDIFSAGIIFHILLTGRPLFHGNDQESVFTSNCELKFDLSSSLYDDLEASSFDLLRGMLQVNPQKRLSATECLSHPYMKGSKNETFETGVEISEAE